MRPFRFLLLLVFFVALPIALTCWSLLATDSPPDFNAGYNGGYTPRPSRLRALFSFSTPSSLFPPSAVISLTNDNSTFFLARPAAFGPSLPSKGLSGQLWVGRGFGDDTLLREENLYIAGWELGCSDVPGWVEERAKSIKHLSPVDHEKKAKVPRDLSIDRVTQDSDESGDTSDDGTDDHLHHPLQDSNPATPGKPGEAANADSSKDKKPTHADIESLQESAAIAGKIVMLSRGGCGFLEKVKWAQRRGGIALIVGDNERGAQLTIMYAKGDISNVTIPALFTSYTSAHLLSSLVPPEEKHDETHPKAGKGSPAKPHDQQDENNKPIFTSTQSAVTRATTLPDEDERGWVGNVLSAIGLSENSPFSQHEDSRRPPSSGNVEWVLVEDWKDEGRPDLIDDTNTLSSVATLSTSILKPKSTSSKRPGGDDFVIGVQDWRDTDLVAPKAVPTAGPVLGQIGKHPVKPVSSVRSSSDPEATLQGGSITPGSGEYNHEKSEPLNRFNHGNGPSNQRYGHDTDRQSQERASWLDVFRSGPATEEIGRGSPAESDTEGKEAKDAKSATTVEHDDQPGLWVTLTPTNVSTSPFFDTLLVLVVSPLVTLTVVYALLLLRSRIRRRRWRAPKSVVDRLPVRTYHTIASASSTTSSQVASPDHSSPTSPLLISANQNMSQRPRPRSQTAAGSYAGGSSLETQPLLSRSPNTEKASPATPKSPKRKRYTGRQIECVVCLEEYVDGESRVMSLPCGHEFHVDCITPWLVTRRRTCPICKGDVVRSLARQRTGSLNDDDSDVEDEANAGVQPAETTSDDIQSRVAQTVNDEPSAAIPIPSFNRDDEDIERGQDLDVPLLEGDESLESSSTIAATSGSVTDTRPLSRRGRDGERQSLWRNIVSASVNRLSGDTLWRQPPVDRNR